MKIKGQEVYAMSENGFLAITYSQFDMGDKYKLYRKVSYIQDDGSGETRDHWTYVSAFDSIVTATRNMERMPDIQTIR